jgi:hypothetical protein
MNDIVRQYLDHHTGYDSEFGMDSDGFPDKSLWNDTALHDACFKGHLMTVQLLIKIPSTNVNCLNSHGMTPLMVAAMKLQLEIVDELLECDKVDKTMKGYGKWNALRCAVSGAKCVFMPSSAEIHGFNARGPTRQFVRKISIPSESIAMKKRATAVVQKLMDVEGMDCDYVIEATPIKDLIALFTTE